jgi:predicted GH43/DUF377 family glycosyl hydrolase
VQGPEGQGQKGQHGAGIDQEQAAPAGADGQAAHASTSPNRDTGWVKHPANPLIGGDLGTCFDLAALHDDGKYRMWFSWRPQRSLALVESEDGVNWSEPVIVLGPNEATGWEYEVNRPVVVKREDGYHMWYTGQIWKPDRSFIGYATSPDGVSWTRMSEQPVMTSVEPWEDVALMCPHVIWDDKEQLYRMWYSGGEQYEPNAIGYATSKDGMNWEKYAANPVFTCDRGNPWEQHKTTACQVVPYKDGYAMFYVGFHDEDFAQIGLAWSKDGLGDWVRHPDNPIISPEPGNWDAEANYKPFAIYNGEQWMLWYNGRTGSTEQIGLVTKDGADLGF